MGGGAQQLKLDRAADLLGVSLNALERRLRRGDLPEAEPLDGRTASLGDPSRRDTESWTLPASSLPSIASREGWVIDLRNEEARVTLNGVEIAGAEAANGVPLAERSINGAVPARPTRPGSADVSPSPNHPNPAQPSPDKTGEDVNDKTVTTDVQTDEDHAESAESTDLGSESTDPGSESTDPGSESTDNGNAVAEADEVADSDLVDDASLASTDDIVIDLTDSADTEPVDAGSGDTESVDAGAAFAAEPLVIESGAGLDEMLERLLTMSSDLTEAVIARERAERTVEAQAVEITRTQNKIIANEAVIERQEAENDRLGTDLNRALADVRVAEALSDERGIRIDELRHEIEQQRTRSDDEIRRHRAQNAELRRRLEASTNAMGWWSKRRLRDRPVH